MWSCTTAVTERRKEKGNCATNARGTAAKFSEGLKKERCTAVACTCIQ